MPSSRVAVVLQGSMWGEEHGVDVGAETFERDDGVLVGSATSGGVEVGTEDNVRTEEVSIT